MFTGIITHQGVIQSIENGTFTISNPFQLPLEIGQSIAHDGACMSITQITSDTYSFFAMQESFAKTNFGNKQPGDSFNLELCMVAGQRFDGHFVTGHIDTTAQLTTIENADDGSRLLGFSYNPERSSHIVAKGSIAINGVSLTVVDAKPGYVSVRLIPFTLEKTNLGALQKDDIVNIEFDMLGKYVLQATSQYTTS